MKSILHNYSLSSLYLLRNYLNLILPVLISMLIIFSAEAFEPMVYQYHGPETTNDKRYEYHWLILRKALERTIDRYGPYKMTGVDGLSEARQEYEMLKGNLINTYISEPIPNISESLIPVRIPIAKGLMGYRVLFIEKHMQPKFSMVNSLDDLQKWTIGSHQNWVDTEVLRKGGFNVVTGSSYDGLFRMLLSKRFDAFSRGAAEITSEYEQFKSSLPALHIEKSLLLYFPLPMFFWFPKSEYGELLAERVRVGMIAMVEDGSLDKQFNMYYKSAIEQLNLASRKIFRINNPTLTENIDFDDKRLWYIPSLTEPEKEK